MRVTAPTLRNVLRDVYGDVGPAWSSGPAVAYERMAAIATARLPPLLTGWRVLDLGAGTGAVSRCVSESGGWPVALDPAHGMLREVRSPACTVAEAEHLPFGGGCFEAVVAAFSLSHVPRPALALEEVRRVLRPEGYLLIVSFRAEAPHPAKLCVDEVAQRFGFRPPAWYAELKALETAVNTPDALRGLVSRAGLLTTRVEEVRIDSGVDTASDLVRWRLGMAHLSPFVAGLSPADQAHLIAQATRALGPAPQPWRPTVLILSSRAPA